MASRQTTSDRGRAQSVIPIGAHRVGEDPSAMVHATWAWWGYAFAALAVVRCLGALTSPIMDCDETFNYWEPTHYVLEGFGLQTWEYSPVYGIRSYAYLLPHAAAAKLAMVFGAGKIGAFYFTRCLLGLACAACEASFCAAAHDRMGRRIGLLTLAFLGTSAGMFHAGVAYLPSTFSMYMVMVAYQSWIRDDFVVSVVAAAAATILGWPFVLFVFPPLALDAILARGFFRTLMVAAAGAGGILAVTIAIDYAYFRQVVVASLNIVLYNVLGQGGGGGGANLYGTEPWTFYALNGFLNFNVLWPLALLGTPVLLVVQAAMCAGKGGAGNGGADDDGTSPIPRHWLAALRMGYFLLPLYMWMAVFLYQEHKEERFLFVIYPLVALAAAVACEVVAGAVDKTVPLVRAWSAITRPICGPRGSLLFPTPSRLPLVLLVIGTATISASRGASLVKGYGAPLQVYGELSAHIATESADAESVRVCVGKEWHRYGSAFFLPGNARLAFLKSNFGGQTKNGTWIVPANFNDANKEEPSRYVALDTCDYVVDLELPGQDEPVLDQQDPDRWKLVASAPFLDAERSHRLFRAFYVPRLGASKVAYGRYHAVRQVKKASSGSWF
eukprot:g4374.t1